MQDEEDAKKTVVIRIADAQVLWPPLLCLSRFFFEKPLREEGALSPHLCLCRAGLGCAVAGQGEHATSTFKIKRRMAMRKVFAACADKWRVPVATLKFTFDGEAIGGEDNADTV